MYSHYLFHYEIHGNGSTGLELISPFFFYIPEAINIIKMSRGVGQRAPLHFHSGFSQPRDSHMLGYRRKEQATETSGERWSHCAS